MSLQFFALELYRMSLHFFCYTCLCSSQLALVAGGRGETRRRNGKKPKARKLLENAARTHLSTSIIRKDMADRLSTGPSETVVQLGSPSPRCNSPNS